MSQRYYGNTKRPKPQDTPPEILKIYGFCHKIQQRASGPGERAYISGATYLTIAGVTYLAMKINPKRCHIFPLKAAATLLNVSRKGAVGAL